MNPDLASKEFNLYIEELCCDLLRFEHAKSGADPRVVRISREVPIEAAGTFADILVEAPDSSPYVVEVKFGRTADEIVERLKAKFAGSAGRVRGAARVVLLTNAQGRDDLPRLKQDAARALTDWRVEIWTEKELRELLRAHVGRDLESFDEASLLDAREAVDAAKIKLAFEGADPQHAALQGQLMWHFGWWKLRQLHRSSPGPARDILRPGMYRNAVVVNADLCSFTGFLRDTRDDQVARESLTTFYSQARYEIINHGGMIYQFLGDAVLAVFGVPEATPGCVDDALEAARALVNVGRSTADYWQRRIDRVQKSQGLHVGMAIGDLQVMSMRPFSRSHIGAVGDSINIASRLLSSAEENEIVASNTLHAALSPRAREGFVDIGPVDIRNGGTIHAWRLSAAPQSKR